MNNKNKIMNCTGSQKGIALLFSLAILALLLVMALGFATNAIFDQRSAYNSANVASARILAQAELNKVLTLLKYYDSGIYYSHSIDNSMICNNNPTSDMLERLQTKEGNSYIFQWKNGYDSYINWNYIKVNDGTVDHIIGRTAFVLIPDEGIDPGTLVNKDQDESLNSQEIRIGANVYEINVRSIDPSITQPIATVFNYTRPPYTPVANPGQYNGNWIDFPTMFNYFTIASQSLNPGMKDNFRRWFVIDVPNDKEAFWIDLNNNKVIDKDPASAAFELFHRFYLPHYTDVNSNGVYDAGVDTNNWNGMDVDKDILFDNDKNGIPDILLTKWTLAGPVTTPGGIPWLAFFGYKTDGTVDLTQGATFGTTTDMQVAARRRQIAANLIDYCDTDSVPTSDISPATWANPAVPSICAIPPTYTGNEKTPYLNEVGIYATVSAASDNGLNKSTVTIQISLMAEIINIYNQIKPADLKNAEIVISGSYYYYLSVASGASDIKMPASNPQTFTKKITIAPGDWVQSAYGAQEIVLISDTASLNKKQATVNVNSVVVKIDKICLTYNGANVDFAVLSDPVDLTKGSTGTWTFFSAYSLVGGDATREFYASWQAVDPRQNLNSGDWLPYFTASVGGLAPLAPAANTWTVKSVNTASNPSASTKDKETVTDPAYINGNNISTAFIRDAPMLSPWELGFIHRGAAWETINLKEYDKFKAAKVITVAGNKYCPGGGKYSDTANGGGDANILDEIKMTDQTTSSKKINIKTHMDEILKALLNKVRIGCIPDPNSVPVMDLNSMAVTGGASIDTSLINADVLIGKIKEKNINFFTRAGIADVTEYATGTTDPAPLNVASRNTDAKQEELIGKTVNLCEVGGQIEFFTIIVLAQTIRDVGTNGGAGITIVKVDKNGTKQTMSAKLGIFDYIKIGTYVEDGITKQSCVYADEIIGEQKIKVRGYRDASGNCQILSYEYVE